MNKLKGIVVSLLLYLTVFGHANAGKYVEHGSVSINGRVFETPCNIAPESQVEIIDMGGVTLDSIEAETNPPIVFSIQLVNCNISYLNSKAPAPQYFQVSFDGESHGKYFDVNGTASGIAIEIKDASGNEIYPGKKLAPNKITPGTMKFDYSLWVVKDHDFLQLGTFSATIKFKLDYY